MLWWDGSFLSYFSPQRIQKCKFSSTISKGWLRVAGPSPPPRAFPPPTFNEGYIRLICRVALLRSVCSDAEMPSSSSIPAACSSVELLTIARTLPLQGYDASTKALTGLLSSACYQVSRKGCQDIFTVYLPAETGQPRPQYLFLVWRPPLNP